MPKIITVDGVRIMMFTNDHLPPHVHAIGPEGEARFALNCPTGPVVMMDADGFSRASLARIARRLAENVDVLCSRWRSIHG